MPTISKESKLLTLINIFTVEPAKQRELVDLLIGATETSVRHITGFVSATLNRSLDGTKVAMYAQWRSDAQRPGCLTLSRPSPLASQVRSSLSAIR